MRRARPHACAVLLVAAHATLPSLALAQAPVAQDEVVRVLGTRAIAVYDRGDFAGALELFTAAYRLYPTPQYRIWMARSADRLGKLRRAAELLDEAARMPKPARPPPHFDEARKLAGEELAKLRARIPALQVDVEGPADARIEIDDAEVPAGARGRVEVDPGAHVVVAVAPGYERWSQTFTPKEGETLPVAVHLVRVAVAPPPPPVPPVSPAPQPTTTERPPSLPPPPPENLSHRQQFGAFIRADVDALHPGARAATGITYGVIDHLEVGLGAILGARSGVEPRVTGYFFQGKIKPFVDAGAPIFFVPRAIPGIRGSVGVQWDPIRHLGVFAQLGGAYFFNTTPDYVPYALLPAFGVQGRL